MYPPEAVPAKPLTIPQGIALVEGWYAHGAIANRPQRNNNPGDLEYHAWMAEKYGAVLETVKIGTPRFACFPTPDNGWAALDALLASKYAGMTIEATVNEFAPPVENNDTAYVDAVCNWTGKQATDLVSA